MIIKNNYFCHKYHTNPVICLYPKKALRTSCKSAVTLLGTLDFTTKHFRSNYNTTSLLLRSTVY